LAKEASLKKLHQEVLTLQQEGLPLAQWLKRPENTPDKLPGELLSRYRVDLWNLVETDLKYEGYLRREEEQIKKQQRQESQRIPSDLDHDTIPSMRLEARQKLRAYKPETLGQASRISGITPADISVLSVWIKKTTTAYVSKK